MKPQPAGKSPESRAGPKRDAERAVAATGLALSGARRWAFRLVAMTAPIVALYLAELGLRLFGYGYPTSFFLKARVEGQPALIENREFARRYFPPGLARSPQPVAVPAIKPPDSCRIFVFGESAAMGDPEPAFGFPRILEMLLRARYPGKEFQVINVAVTAINSHVIRQIARDCAPLRGDVWIIYMGNNEVVGPFGAGTVFGSQTPPLGAIRASIALQGTRLGQLLNALKWRLARRPETPVTWAGMEMFLKQQIRRDDPRMAKVYDYFQKNLEDILQIGQRCGARVLVSSVVANLKDCAPFASLHRPGLTDAALATWEVLYRRGAAEEAAGDHAGALLIYQEAARLDDQYAELHFRLGRCHWALGQDAEAQKAFEQALEWDTLRFRSDGRINEIIRTVAVNHASTGVRFVDARETVARNSPHGIAGEEFLYEHVHFNYAGNYLMARAFAEQIAELLPSSITAGGSNAPVWLSAEQCTQRLALTDWDRYQVMDEVFKRLQLPPFTHQLDHEQDEERVQQQRAALRSALRAEAFPPAAEMYRQALAFSPDDWVLHENFAKLLEHFGEARQAEQQWRRVLQLMPHYDQAYYGLANVLDAQGKNAEAIRYFRLSLERRPDLHEARNGLGLALAAQGQVAEAIEQYQTALRAKPDFAEARVNLGLTLAQQGRIEEALTEYAQALRSNSNSAAAHVNLGKLLARQGKLSEAISHYREAIRLKPDNAVAHFNLGNALSAAGHVEAINHYREAVQLKPDFAEARLNYGIGLAKAGHTSDALAQFQEAARLRPDLAEAHLNLGVALAREQRFAEAVEQFRETLRLDPGNATAQKFLEQAQARAKGRP